MIDGVLKAGLVGITVSIAALALAQRPERPGGPGGRPLREHTAIRTQSIILVPATEAPTGASVKEFRVVGESLRISSNGIPDHLVGRFPNRGNPHTISPQAYEYAVSGSPEVAPEITPLINSPFGFALSGVLFDPGAAEFWMGRRDGGWRYEALGGAVPLGLDENHAHVQPGGIYHYHGIPTLLLKRLGAVETSHSPQVGWAADGFPIYARIGYTDPKNPAKGVKTLTSAWQLKPGNRPAEPDGPGGTHDGTFIQDYIFVAGSGDLDECNGRFCVTPEFPGGTYAYFLTDQWPVIPRAFRGTPVEMREHRGPR